MGAVKDIFIQVQEELERTEELTKEEFIEKYKRREMYISEWKGEELLCYMYEQCRYKSFTKQDILNLLENIDMARNYASNVDSWKNEND